MGKQAADIHTMEDWGEGELEPAEQCLACLGGHLSPYYEGLDDLLGGLPGQWGHLQCKGCLTLNLSPRPTSAAIGRAYPADYVTHASGAHADARDNGVSWIWRLANGYLNARYKTQRAPASCAGRWVIPLMWPIRQQLDYFFRHLPATPGRVLDVGCGNGAFLLRARAAGWIAHGIEPDALAARQAKESGLDVHNCSIEQFTAEVLFDRITLSHVFEHLHAPREALCLMRSWLVVGGELWLSLPNVTGLGHQIFQRNWFSLDPPRHLFLPTPRQVVAMLESAGYQDVRLLRRGRGARSSVAPSAGYVQRRTGRRFFGARAVAFAIDVLGSILPSYSEEIVVCARRGH